MLYVTPELVLTESFRNVLKIVYKHGELSRIAIDEAHCVSEWGHDFRPAYYHLSHLRANFSTVPIICLTATAAPSIRTDIIKTLGLDPVKTRTFITTTARQNLHYSLQFMSDESDNRFSWLLDFLQGIYARRTTDTSRAQEVSNELPASKQRPDAISGIIYVSFRSDCETLASRLRNKSIGAAPYHAGLSAHERAECQYNWINNVQGFDIIVATTAFGMGIDKNDVRFVVHWTLPKSFEGYYQEAGRVGRDGKAALCMLFYSREDRDRVGYRISKDVTSNTGKSGTRGNQAQLQSRVASFQALVKYCEQTDRCRHVVIGEFFCEQNVQACDKACDVCFKRPGEPDLKRRREDGLSSEEWVSTQKEKGDFYGDDYD